MHQRYQLMTSYVSSAGCRAHAFHIAHKAHGQNNFELNLMNLTFYDVDFTRAYHSLMQQKMCMYRYR